MSAPAVHLSLSLCSPPLCVSGSAKGISVHGSSTRTRTNFFLLLKAKLKITVPDKIAGSCKRSVIIYSEYNVKAPHTFGVCSCRISLSLRAAFE